jgi:hypothetical protein
MNTAPNIYAARIDGPVLLDASAERFTSTSDVAGVVTRCGPVGS